MTQRLTGCSECDGSITRLVILLSQRYHNNELVTHIYRFFKAYQCGTLRASKSTYQTAFLRSAIVHETREGLCLVVSYVGYWLTSELPLLPLYNGD